MANVKQETKDQTFSVEAELSKLRDEIRLKAGLAKLEAKDSLEHAESYLSGLIKTIDTKRLSATNVSDEARLQFHLALMEAKEKWEGARKELSQLVSAASNSDLMNDAKERAELLPLRAKLAKLEVSEYWDNQAVAWRKKSKDLKGEIEKKTDELATQFNESVRDFSKLFRT